MHTHIWMDLHIYIYYVKCPISWANLGFNVQEALIMLKYKDAGYYHT